MSNRNANGGGDVTLEDTPEPISTRRPSISQKALIKAKYAATFVAKDISGPKVPWKRVTRAVWAEFFGTMFFVFAVAASVTIPANLGANIAVGQLITAFIQGLTLAAMVSATGPMSGGHLNPAVTLSLMMVRTIPILRGLMYIVAQMLGAMAGAALLSVAVGWDASGTLGATVPTVSSGRAFAMEFMISAILIYTVLGTAVHGGANGVIKALAPLPIGFAVIAGVLIAKNVTGASMNPARSFGPAVVSGTWTRHWLYWVSPLAAAVVVGLVYKAFFLSTSITRGQARRAGLLPIDRGDAGAGGENGGERPNVRSQDTVVDMPGIYSHTSLSEADLIARTGEDDTGSSN